MNYLLLAFICTVWGTAACVKTPEKLTRILLTESTRGTLRSIEATQKQVTVAVNGEKSTAPLDSLAWNSLVKQALALPMDDLQSIPILSKRHQVDAALHATLTFVTEDTTFTSPTFDHNAPPEAFKALVHSLYQQLPASMKARFGQ